MLKINRCLNCNESVWTFNATRCFSCSIKIRTKRNWDTMQNEAVELKTELKTKQAILSALSKKYGLSVNYLMQHVNTGYPRGLRGENMLLIKEALKEKGFVDLSANEIKPVDSMRLKSELPCREVAVAMHSKHQHPEIVRIAVMPYQEDKAIEYLRNTYGRMNFVRDLNDLFGVKRRDTIEKLHFQRTTSV